MNFVLDVFCFGEGAISLIRTGAADSFRLPVTPYASLWLFMNSTSRNSVSTQANGQVYRPAVGRAADRVAVEDHRSNNLYVVRGMPDRKAAWQRRRFVGRAIVFRCSADNHIALPATLHNSAQTQDGTPIPSR
jgi:hypothetical protein